MQEMCVEVRNRSGTIDLLSLYCLCFIANPAKVKRVEVVQ